MKTHLYQSPGEMHNDTLHWISELEFMADEQQFMSDLLNDYFLTLSSEALFPESRTLVKRLSDSRNSGKALLERLREHHNGLAVLLDGIDQPYEESEFKAAHRTFREDIAGYEHDFKQLKRDIFDVIMKIMKHDKQNRRLN